MLEAAEGPKEDKGWPKDAMLAGKRKRDRWTGWMWLLLVAISVHAVLPVGSPLARTAGSAFSVSTVDVSVAPSRKRALPSTAAAIPDPDPTLSGTGDDALDAPAVIPALDPAPDRYRTAHLRAGADQDPVLPGPPARAKARAPPPLV